jgi:hypothetical protein
VQVETVGTSVQKPSNVALYVAGTAGGEPATDLEAKNFKIYENGELLSAKQTGRTLVPTTSVTDQRVVLLVDLSHDPPENQRQVIARAAEALVRKLVETVPVSVRAYDGGESLLSVGDFPRGAKRHEIRGILTVKTRDSSRNLNGAITLGLDALDAQRSGKPIRLGTLVVFARGPDLAGRVSEDALWEAMNETKYELVGIVIGPDTRDLDFLRGGVVHAQDFDALPIAFEEAGSKVRALHQKYYLVQYCSPARAGTRDVRLEVSYTDIEGEEKSGSTSFELDASGFRAGCNPEATPRFETPPERKSRPGTKAKPGSAPGAAEPEPDIVAPPPSGDYVE